MSSRAVREAIKDSIGGDEIVEDPPAKLDLAAQQRAMLAQQDEHLDELEAGVKRLGVVGRAIGDELESQSRSAPAHDNVGIP